MVAFVNQHKIRPVVDVVLDGLDKAEDGFQRMLKGSQFGKIVIVPNGQLPNKLWWAIKSVDLSIYKKVTDYIFGKKNVKRLGTRVFT